MKYDISDMKETARLLGISPVDAKKILGQMSDDQYVNFMDALANGDTNSAAAIAKDVYNGDIYESVNPQALYKSITKSLTNDTNITPVFYFVPVETRESVLRMMYPSQSAKLLSKLKGFSTPVFEANMRMSDVTVEIEKLCAKYDTLVAEALPAMAAVSQMNQDDEEDDEDSVVVPSNDKQSVTKAKIVQDMGNSIRVKTPDGRTQVVNKRDAARMDHQKDNRSKY